MALVEDAARLYSDGLSERSIASVLGIDCNQKPSRGNGNVYDITILGDRAVRVAEILYNDCRMRMRRKHDIYMSWVAMRDGGVKC